MSLDLTGFDTEEQLREGEYNPPEPGIYHLAVSAVDTAPVSKGGEALDGIKVSFQVLAGTVEGMEGREFQSIFFYPNANAKDGGKFASKRLAMLGLATEVIDRSQLGKSVDPNWEDMAARHFIAEVEHRESNGKTFPDIKGLHIWHVNHPDAAKYRTDAEVMAEMPMTWKPEGAATAPAASTKAASPSAAAAPKPGTPRPGAKKPAAATASNGNGDKSASAAAAAEGGKSAYDSLLDD
jgi:hypothetical protein